MNGLSTGVVLGADLGMSARMCTDNAPYKIPLLGSPPVFSPFVTGTCTGGRVEGSGGNCSAQGYIPGISIGGFSGDSVR